jgi:hypothetical protein
MRGPDKRDKNPNLRRVVPPASTFTVILACCPIFCFCQILVSIIVAIIGVCIHQYNFLWALVAGAAFLIAGLGVQALLGEPKYEHIVLTIQELRAYEGQHVYIHFLNNVTGYEDGWYPFYGATEEFVRVNGPRPELCVAPYEQYERGWVAYSHKPEIQSDKRKEPHEHT